MTRFKRDALGASIVILALALTMWIGWVGHLASDDASYIGAARGWLQDFPFIPDNHWAVRHPLTLAIAASFAVFGDSEIASILPSILYGLALFAMVFVVVRREFGVACATLVCCFLVITPLITESMTTAGVDVVETCFVFASVFALQASVNRQGSLGLLLLSGIFAGIAFLSRETAIALVAFYGMKFLFSPGMARWRYIVAGVGFWLVAGAEMAYYAYAAGDPFLRLSIALGTVELPDPNTGTGNITSDRWFGPPASLFANNEFGFLFFLACGAGLWLWRTKPELGDRQKRFLTDVALLAVVWFVVVGYALDLRALPRYFYICTVAAALFSGLFIWLLYNRGFSRTAALLCGMYLVTSLLLTDLSNQQPLLAERTAIALVERDPGLALYTDPRTAWRSASLRGWSGAPEHILDSPAPPGSLFLFNRIAVAEGRAGPAGAFDRASFMPAPDWERVETYKGRPTRSGRLLIALGLADFIERLGLARLVWEAPPIVLYRTR